jgi:predicted helicase
VYEEEGGISNDQEHRQPSDDAFVGSEEPDYLRQVRAEDFSDSFIVDFLPNYRKSEKPSEAGGFTFQSGENRHRDLCAKRRSIHAHCFFC